jgi:hypothetical protein
VSFWYTGPDLMLSFTPEYALLDWANERERMKLQAAIDYIVMVRAQRQGREGVDGGTLGGSGVG